MNDKTAVSRRRFLSHCALNGLVSAAGGASWIIVPQWANAAAEPIRVGVATDLSGPLLYAGNAQANVAKMLVKSMNDEGGLLGRPLQLFIEDTASNEALAFAAARTLMQRDKVDLIIGGTTSSTRDAVQASILLRGKALYIYPMLHEGDGCAAELFHTGPTPAQQCDELIPWIVKTRGRRFAIPVSDFAYSRAVAAYARKLIEVSGGEVVLEQIFSLEEVDFGSFVDRIVSNKTDVVFNLLIPPGLGRLFRQLSKAGFAKNGGHLVCVFYDENLLGSNTLTEIEGLVSRLDYYRALVRDDPASAKLQAMYDKEFPHSFPFAATGGASGTYRAIKFWEAAVKEAGGVDLDAVAAALDHAKIAEGPGGPAEMVAGSRHCKMKMHTAVCRKGKFEIINSSNGLLDPREC
jgi:ABC-type branched-subunit amino acid transport system substrate-binding protein